VKCTKCGRLIRRGVAYRQTTKDGTTTFAHTTRCDFDSEAPTDRAPSLGLTLRPGPPRSA
jgi:hypothetical protein